MKHLKPVIYCKNFLDMNQNPDGGAVEGLGLAIKWHRGPMKIVGEDLIPPNGALVESVVQAAKQRLEHFQTTRFRCDETAQAIIKLQEAIDLLHARTARRDEEGKSGTHQGDVAED